MGTCKGVPQVFHYAAHGTPLGFDSSTAATTFLYSGEQTDATATGEDSGVKESAGENRRGVADERAVW